MGIIGDLVDMMADTVTIEPFVSQSETGTRTYGDGVERQCRVVGKSSLVLDEETGRESVSTVQVWLAGFFDTSPKDRVTLPDRFNPRQPRIMSVSKMTDEDGEHHEKLFL